jgi:hypothetical protein
MKICEKMASYVPCFRRKAKPEQQPGAGVQLSDDAKAKTEAGAMPTDAGTSLSSSNSVTSPATPVTTPTRKSPYSLRNRTSTQRLTF